MSTTITEVIEQDSLETTWTALFQDDEQQHSLEHEEECPHDEGVLSEGEDDDVVLAHLHLHDPSSLVEAATAEMVNVYKSTAEHLDVIGSAVETMDKLEQGGNRLPDPLHEDYQFIRSEYLRVAESMGSFRTQQIEAFQALLQSAEAMQAADEREAYDEAERHARAVRVAVRELNLPQYAALLKQIRQISERIRQLNSRIKSDADITEHEHKIYGAALGVVVAAGVVVAVPVLWPVQLAMLGLYGLGAATVAGTLAWGAAKVTKLALADSNLADVLKTLEEAQTSLSTMREQLVSMQEAGRLMQGNTHLTPRQIARLKRQQRQRLAPAVIRGAGTAIDALHQLGSIGRSEEHTTAPEEHTVATEETNNETAVRGRKRRYLKEHCMIS